MFTNNLEDGREAPSKASSIHYEIIEFEDWGLKMFNWKSCFFCIIDCLFLNWVFSLLLFTYLQIEILFCFRPCKVYEHGRTLAVLGPDRTRVLLFNTRTDEMVGAIDTALGSIYHVAISEKLLILLSGKFRF